MVQGGRVGSGVRSRIRVRRSVTPHPSIGRHSASSLGHSQASPDVSRGLGHAVRYAVWGAGEAAAHTQETGGRLCP